MINFTIEASKRTSYKIKISGSIGKACLRNRIKRLIKEAITKNKDKLQGYKITAYIDEYNPLYTVMKCQDIEKLLLEKLYATKNI